MRLVPEDIFNRAVQMLAVAGEHSLKYGYDETSFYDGTDCDGCCIQMDCRNAIDDLEAIGYTAADGEVSP